MTNYDYFKTLPLEKMATWFAILYDTDLSNVISTYNEWEQFLQEEYSPAIWKLLWKVYENPQSMFDRK